MEIISNIYSTVLGDKITIFSQQWSFRGTHLIKGDNISDFDHKNGRKYFEVIFILMAAKRIGERGQEQNVRKF